LIEVNLLPNGKKKGPRKGAQRTLKLPSLTGGSRDLWGVGTVVAVIAFVAVVGYLYMSNTNRRGDLTVAIAEARADSARYAEIIRQTEELRARRDSIAQRVQVIQEIDRDRYLWPHVMDEVTRALPEYTWLTAVMQIGAGATPELQISGKVGNPRALTLLMRNLEASPFLKDIGFVSSTQELMEDSEGRGRRVFDFQLTAFYEVPPPELLETVPLFQGSTPSGDEGPGAVAFMDAPRASREPDAQAEEIRSWR
jgi:Tfp pilus assembly protein PilN